ncbi:MAG TPA: substrate-binding domain-containing protein [Acidimicrobiales bacterium]|nr:substrate-binding domain-containing protein [Acidimicrobiales bacterium]
MKPLAKEWAFAQRRSLRPATRALIVSVAGLLCLGTVNTTAQATTRGAGPVDVLYAGSLFEVMQRHLAPAFHLATGYSVEGISNGSSALASEIKGGTEVGDVFLSASPSADQALQGVANGQWVTTFSTFATSPLELAYNPRSRFASDLRSRPWYNVVTRPSFILGRTDPASDPKGVLAVEALRSTAQRRHRPGLLKLATSKANVFEETAMIGELEAGQLDAGFFYAVEAKAAKLPTVPLTGVNLGAKYTAAVLRHAPHGAAAHAFVAFLESRVGKKILAANGLSPLPTVRAAP